MFYRRKRGARPQEPGTEKRYNLRQRAQLVLANALISIGCRMRAGVVRKPRKPRVQMQIR